MTQGFRSRSRDFPRFRAAYTAAIITLKSLVNNRVALWLTTLAGDRGPRAVCIGLVGLGGVLNV